MPALLRPFRSRKPKRTVPEGLRVYAVGDVHGCLDQFNRMLDAIDSDLKAHRGPSHLIVLGDLIDRGPGSAGVIERLLGGGLPAGTSDVIMGNHEEVMLDCYDGVAEPFESWLQYGGLETLESYGVSSRQIFDAAFDVGEAMRAAVPAAHIAFLRSLKAYVRLGDYLFVHAGIRPGVALDQQSERDLRWIRRGFLDDPRDHGVTVVHGHSIVREVEFHPNRIAVDTGCHLTGRLSAVVLESDSARAISTGS